MANINGDAGDNSLTDGAGDDIINGKAGNDVIIATTGADRLYGDVGDDVLNAMFDDGSKDILVGGEGDDVLLGAQGDQLYGGDGFDAFTLNMATSTAAVHLNLGNLTSGGALHLADGTVVSGMEGGAMSLGLGDDYVHVGRAIVSVLGGGGDDTLIGGKGADFLGGGAGDDLIRGGKGVDTVIYADATSGVRVDLSNHNAQNTGGAGHDKLGGIENIIGSVFDDHLTGTRGDNSFQGTLGADTMTGHGGADTFLFGAYVESTADAADHITDLGDDDTIDLHLMDANANTAEDDAFTLVSRFTHHAGEAVLSVSGGDTRLELDVTGDGQADAVIVLEGDHRDFDGFVL
jgi:Ca2+-binding RTX toxin-like protein